MRFPVPLIIGSILVLAACSTVTRSPARPPVAARQPHVRELHGERFVDDYFWLRQRTNAAVAAYLEAENAYTAAVMRPTLALQRKLYREIVGRIQETDFSVPARKGAWRYYYRTEKGRQYRIHCRKPATADGPEQVTLDVNALARGQKFMSVMGLTFSDDAHLLAYLSDNVGYRQYRLRVRDLRSGRDLPDTAERVTSVAWAADNQTLFFTTEDETTKRSDKLFRLHLGQPPQLVYEEKDERFNVGVGRTRSDRFLTFVTGSLTASEWRLLEASQPAGEWKLVAARQPDHEYALDHRGEELFIWSNRTGRNFALFTAPVATPDPAHWKELVPHRADVKIESVVCFQDHYVVEERAAGLIRFQITRVQDGARHAIQFPEPAYLASVGDNLEFRTGCFRYRYESPRTPDSVFDHDLQTGVDTLLKREPVLGGFDPANYLVERLEATAPDGTRVPVTVLQRRDAPRDGSAPLLLYGYGAYGFPTDPSFDSPRFSLVDRGVTLALAHIRGGGDLGKPWHDAGRLAQKMNTFTDFIACAEHLVTQRYTRPERLAIMGGSAGGLLMGAVVNLRPDLFHTVVSQVPFVDVLNTMSDKSLPLTVAEFEEWGNPDVPEQYSWLRRYCPYTNLEAKAYPAMLVRTSFHDSQVMYWEPAKYVARLRALKTDDHPLLLQVNLAGGHGGSSGRYDQFKETAFDCAFILTQAGIRE